MGATAAIAAFIANTSARDFPAQAEEKSKKAIADTFAVMIAGAGSEVADPLRNYIKASVSPGPYPVLGTGITTASETAALVNGTFGHALDYDDVLSMMPAHPSAVILAAVLASLNSHGSTAVSGRALIESHVLGVEVGGKIGMGMTVGHYHRGFHATGSLALFSALASLAKLYALDEATVRQAFGIATSMSSGLRCNFGTMTKPLHTGLAARSALSAFRLAAAGFTGSPDALEAKAGLFATLGVPESDVEVTVKGLGQPWVLVSPGLALKQFPCCYATHRGMDALLTLRNSLAFNAQSVDRIICRMPPGGMEVLTFPRPTTGLEGKFSMEYCLAAGVLDGSYALRTFTDEAVRRKDIADLYQRIEVVEDPACRGDDPQFEKRSSGSRGFVEVEARLRDGRRETCRVASPPGAPGRDLSWEDLHAKFRDCARQSGQIAETAADQAFELLRNLEQVKDISMIADLLR